MVYRSGMNTSNRTDQVDWMGQGPGGRRDAAGQVAAQGLNNRQMPSSGLGQVQTNQPQGGGMAGQAASPGDYQSPWFGSSEWYGNLDEYGGTAAANDPGVFWDLYATDKMGLDPGSATGAFYASQYNPTAIAQAYGKSTNALDESLAAGTALGNQLAAPGMTFFDPGQMVGSVLQQLSNPNSELANIIAPIGSDPGTQLNNLISFLQEALSGAMTQEGLQAYLSQIQRAGAQLMNQVAHGGIQSFEKGGGNIGSYLINMLGASGGL